MSTIYCLRKCQVVTCSWITHDEKDKQKFHFLHVNSLVIIEDRVISAGRPNGHSKC